MQSKKSTVTGMSVTRRSFIKGGAGATIAASFLPVLNVRAIGLAAQQPTTKSQAPATKLSPPAQGKIRVAFMLSEGSEFIDFAGPWAVFQAVLDFSRGMNMEDAPVFQLYTVSGSTKPIHVSGACKSYRITLSPMLRNQTW